MDGSGLGTLPVSMSLAVGAIGLVGFVAALVANQRIEKERDAVRRGRNALGDVSIDEDQSFDYRQWLKEQRLDDFHFGDHLRAAADARSSGRAITLNELHQVSARREARRRSARVSGGVTGLLLVCGIAGTLWCIKPVLGAFSVSASPGGAVSGPGSVDVATRMIHDLSEAFWPSLVALILTVFVAAMRGLYAHNRGVLAGELDQLDLEDLFPRFPPPSLGRELDAVRAQLTDLTAQMLASQRNFDGFVQRLTDAAQGFRTDAPPLQTASAQFVEGVRDLGPKLDALGTAIASHLGPTAPVVMRFDGLLAVANDVNKAAGQMQVVSTVLPKQLRASHQLLKDTADLLPEQLQAACRSASTVIADAASQALAAACADAVARLDSAADPLRQAAQSIVEENRALKADTNRAIKQLTQSVDALCSAAAAAVTKEVNASLDGVTRRVDTLLTDTANQFHDRLNQAHQEFHEALAGAVASITTIHRGVDETLTRIAGMMDDLRQVQTRIDTALRDSEAVRDAIDRARGEILAAADRVDAIREPLDFTRRVLTDLKDTLAATTKQLTDLTADLGILHPALKDLLGVQQDIAGRVDMLLSRAEQVGSEWQRWLPEATRLSETGTALRDDLGRLLDQAAVVAESLGTAARAAGEQQHRLAEDLEVLKPVLEDVNRLHRSGLLGRLFGPRT